MPQKTLNTFGKTAIDNYIAKLRANTALSPLMVVEKLRALRFGREGALIRLEDLSYLDFKIKNLEDDIFFRR